MDLIQWGNAVASKQELEDEEVWETLNSLAARGRAI